MQSLCCALEYISRLKWYLRLLKSSENKTFPTNRFEFIRTMITARTMSFKTLCFDTLSASTLLENPIYLLAKKNFLLILIFIIPILLHFRNSPQFVELRKTEFIPTIRVSIATRWKRCHCVWGYTRQCRPNALSIYVGAVIYVYVLWYSYWHWCDIFMGLGRATYGWRKPPHI